MFKYNAGNLKKLEDLLKEAGYVVRYEKGNFNSGYCILENRRVIVINKYFENEARINNLLEILQKLQFDENILSNASRQFLDDLHLQISKA
jgi:hypothetical protein